MRGLSDFGAAIVRPFDRAASALLSIVLTSAEGANRIGDFFGFLGKGMAWPFLTLGGWLRRQGRVLLPEPVRRAFETVSTANRHFFGHFFRSAMRLSERLNLDRLVKGLLWILQPLTSFCLFVYAWLETRRWLKIRWGLPAFVMLLLITIVGAYSVLVGKDAAVSRYQVALKQALEEKNYGHAQLYEHTLAQLGVDTQLAKYNTALAFAEEGQLEQAYQRIQLLAPIDQPGYAAAHFWIVQQVMQGNLDVSESESLKLAKFHLGHLESMNRSSPYVELLQSLLLVRNNQLDKAVDRLEPLLAILPSAAFERLRIDIALQRPEQARKDAQALVVHMTLRNKQKKALSSTEYLWWITAEETLGDWGTMRDLLNRLLALEPDNAAAKRTLVNVCRRQANQIFRTPLPDPLQIIELWFESAELEQSERALQALAVETYHKRSQLPIYPLVLTALCESSRTPAKVLLALGTQAAVEKQYEDARFYLGAALERDASDSAAWNNYGLVLSEGEDVDFEAALTAVDQALKIRPSEYRFHETRGQILIRLERWPEAINELEFALNGMPEYLAIHASLATAYAALGNDELARLHQSRVD